MNVLRKIERRWFYRNFDWCIEGLKNPEFKNTPAYSEKKRATKKKGFREAILAVVLFVGETYFLHLIPYGTIYLFFCLVVSFMFAFGLMKIIAGYAGFPPFH